MKILFLGLYQKFCVINAYSKLFDKNVNEISLYMRNIELSYWLCHNGVQNKHDRYFYPNIISL